MTMELLTSKEAFDGVVQVTAVPPPQDNYNIGSKNMDVLRLEICKAQITKEETTTCLTVMQNHIKNHTSDFMNAIAPYGIIVGIVLVAWSIVAFITRRG